jgi:glucan phosphorylase
VTGIKKWTVVLVGGVAGGKTGETVIQAVQSEIMKRNWDLSLNVLVDEDAQYSGAFGSAYLGLQAQQLAAASLGTDEFDEAKFSDEQFEALLKEVLSRDNRSQGQKWWSQRALQIASFMQYHDVGTSETTVVTKGSRYVARLFQKSQTLVRKTNRITGPHHLSFSPAVQKDQKAAAAQTKWRTLLTAVYVARAIAALRADEETERIAKPELNKDLSPEEYGLRFRQWLKYMNSEESLELYVPGDNLIGIYDPEEYKSKGERARFGKNPVLAAWAAGLRPVVRPEVEFAEALVKNGLESVSLLEAAPGNPPALYVRFKTPFVDPYMKRQFPGLAVALLNERVPDDSSQVSWVESPETLQELTFRKGDALEERFGKLSKLLDLALEGRLLPRSAYTWVDVAGAARAAEVIGRTPQETEAIQQHLSVILDMEKDRTSEAVYERAVPTSRFAGELRGRLEKVMLNAQKLEALTTEDLVAQLPGMVQRIQILYTTKRTDAGKVETVKEGVQQLLAAEIAPAENEIYRPFKPLVHLILAWNTDHWALHEQDNGNFAALLEKKAPVLLGLLPGLKDFLGTLATAGEREMFLAQFVLAAHDGLAAEQKRFRKSAAKEVRETLAGLIRRGVAANIDWKRTPAGHAEYRGKIKDFAAAKTAAENQYWNAVETGSPEEAGRAYAELRDLELAGLDVAWPPVRLASPVTASEDLLKIQEAFRQFRARETGLADTYGRLVSLRQLEEAGNFVEAAALLGTVAPFGDARGEAVRSALEERLSEKLIDTVLWEITPLTELEAKRAALDKHGKLLGGLSGKALERLRPALENLAADVADAALEEARRLEAEKQFDPALAVLKAAKKSAAPFGELKEILAQEETRLTDAKQRADEKEMPAYRKAALEIQRVHGADLKADKHKADLVNAVASAKPIPVKAYEKVTAHLSSLAKAQKLTGGLPYAVKLLLDKLPAEMLPGSQPAEGASLGTLYEPAGGAVTGWGAAVEEFMKLFLKGDISGFVVLPKRRYQALAKIHAISGVVYFVDQTGFDLRTLLNVLVAENFKKDSFLKPAAAPDTVFELIKVTPAYRAGEDQTPPYIVFAFTAASLGAVPDLDLLDEMRINLDPRWGPDAEKLAAMIREQGGLWGRDEERYEKIVRRYEKAVRDPDTEFARRRDLAEPIVGSTVMASTMEAMLSGIRLNPEINVLGEIGQIWEKTNWTGDPAQLTDDLDRRITELREGLIEGHFLSNFNGGLGVLMGDEFGAWADLGVPSSFEAKDEAENGNFLAFGLFYKRGVFVSSVDAKGRQRLAFPFKDQKRENPVSTTLKYPAGHPKAGEDIVLTIPLRNGYKGFVKAEIARVGRVNMVLFNPDIDENQNNPMFREATAHVYKGREGTDERFIQEWILGVGAVELIRALGLNPGAIHLNESATAFMVPALIKYYMDTEGLKDQTALDLVAKSTVFTTHTLEPEALSKYSLYAVPMLDYLKSLFGNENTARWFMDKATHDGAVYPAEWLIRLAQRRNAVSTLNAREATKNFGLPFLGITNGVRRTFWQAEWLQELIEQLPGGLDDFLDPSDPHHRALWESLHPKQPVLLKEKSPLSNRDLRDQKLRMKQRMIGVARLYVAAGLIQNIRELTADIERGAARLAEGFNGGLAQQIEDQTRWRDELLQRLKNIPNLLDEKKLIATWARRVVGYKRMLFSMVGEHLPEVEDRLMGGGISDEEMDRLIRSLEERGGFRRFEDLINNGVQFIFAGKTHPEYKEGLATIRLLHRIIERFNWHNQVVYVPGYDERLSTALVEGSDLWFASSELPREASGTSGMKAMMNGTIILSTNDGFVRDGIVNGVNGLVYGRNETPPRDRMARVHYYEDEHKSLHQTLFEAIKMFYSPDPGGVPENWSRLMRASIYYSSLVFGMDHVEKGRIVPPEGVQRGYFQLYSEAARDAAQEIFLDRFRKEAPEAAVSVENGAAKIRFSARISTRPGFDPSGYDVYFWYGKDGAEWEPVKAAASVTQGMFEITADAPPVALTNAAQRMGVTYFAVRKGTPIASQPRQHWAPLAIWRGRPGQDVMFQVPASSLGGLQKADLSELTKEQGLLAAIFLAGVGALSWAVLALTRGFRKSVFQAPAPDGRDLRALRESREEAAVPADLSRIMSPRLAGFAGEYINRYYGGRVYYGDYEADRARALASLRAPLPLPNTPLWKRWLRILTVSPLSLEEIFEREESAPRSWPAFFSPVVEIPARPENARVVFEDKKYVPERGWFRDREGDRYYQERFDAALYGLFEPFFNVPRTVSVSRVEDGVWQAVRTEARMQRLPADFGIANFEAVEPADVDFLEMMPLNDPVRSMTASALLKIFLADSSKTVLPPVGAAEEGALPAEGVNFWARKDGSYALLDLPETFYSLSWISPYATVSNLTSASAELHGYADRFNAAAGNLEHAVQSIMAIEDADRRKGAIRHFAETVFFFAYLASVRYPDRTERLNSPAVKIYPLLLGFPYYIQKVLDLTLSLEDRTAPADSDRRKRLRDFQEAFSAEFSRLDAEHRRFIQNELRAIADPAFTSDIQLILSYMQARPVAASLGGARYPGTAGVIAKYRDQLRQGVSPREVVATLFKEAGEIHPPPIKPEHRGLSRLRKVAGPSGKSIVMIAERHQDPTALKLLEQAVAEQMFDGERLNTAGLAFGLENLAEIERMGAAIDFIGAPVQVAYVLSRLFEVRAFDAVRNVADWAVVEKALGKLADPASPHYAALIRAEFLVYLIAGMTHSFTPQGPPAERAAKMIETLLGIWANSTDVTRLREELRGYYVAIVDVMKKPVAGRELALLDKVRNLVREVHWETNRDHLKERLAALDLNRLVVIGGYDHFDDVQAGAAEWFGITGPIAQPAPPAAVEEERAKYVRLSEDADPELYTHLFYGLALDLRDALEIPAEIQGSPAETWVREAFRSQQENDPTLETARFYLVRPDRPHKIRIEAVRIPWWQFWRHFLRFFRSYADAEVEGRTLILKADLSSRQRFLRDLAILQSQIPGLLFTHSFNPEEWGRFQTRFRQIRSGYDGHIGTFAAPDLIAVDQVFYQVVSVINTFLQFDPDTRHRYFTDRGRTLLDENFKRSFSAVKMEAGHMLGGPSRPAPVRAMVLEQTERYFPDAVEWMKRIMDGSPAALEKLERLGEWARRDREGFTATLASFLDFEGIFFPRELAGRGEELDYALRHENFHVAIARATEAEKKILERGYRMLLAAPEIPAVLTELFAGTLYMMKMNADLLHGTFYALEEIFIGRDYPAIRNPALQAKVEAVFERLAARNAEFAKLPPLLKVLKERGAARAAKHRARVETLKDEILKGAGPFEAASLGAEREVTAPVRETLPADETVPDRVRAALSSASRSPEAVLEIALRLTDGILYLQGDAEVLNWALQKLGLLTAERPAQKAPKYSRRFNAGELDAAIRRAAGAPLRTPDSARNRMPLVVFDQVLNAAEDRLRDLAGELAESMERGDLVAVVWKDQVPRLVESLHRIKQAKGIEVRTVREELAGAQIPRWLKSFENAPIAVSSVSRGFMELTLPGEKVTLDLDVFRQTGLNPVKFLSLLRQIADQPESFGKLGFIRAADTGYWMVGAEFARFIENLSIEEEAARLAAKAA